jgi:MalT-like TPR region
MARTRLALQDRSGAIAILDDLDDTWKEMYHTGPQQILQGWRALISGDAARIPSVLAGMDNSDEWQTHAHLFFFQEQRKLVEARLLVTQGQLESAREMLADLAHALETGGRAGLRIQALALLAETLQKMDRPQDAQLALEHARAYPWRECSMRLPGLATGPPRWRVTPPACSMPFRKASSPANRFHSKSLLLLRHSPGARSLNR